MERKKGINIDVKPPSLPQTTNETNIKPNISYFI